MEKAEAANIQSDNEVENTSTITITKADQKWLENLEKLTRKSIVNTNFSGYQLALEMEVSYSQLYRKTKLLIGFTPKQYINQIRYQQARQFLENRTYTSIKRVAYEVGFKDEKNFSRNFRKRFGKYPSEYLE
ncbi:MAG: helix-turn-helix domain-containing protein [Saprospiraceae bacterium]